MADKQPVIVIKKITIQAAGAHGGSWKVAFADFMTALMAFFLVMWLVNQSDEVKQNVSDYFSTPSIIEYNFSNYGVELTLEKLFLDLMNEPLRFFEQFITPVDQTPNIMMMGMKKLVIHHMAEQLGDLAQNVAVTDDEITFDIPAKYLFAKGTSNPSAQFVEIMDKVNGITGGLEDSNLYINSTFKYASSAQKHIQRAKNVAERRLDFISKKVEVGLEHESVDILGKISIGKAKSAKLVNTGFINFRIQQKDFMSDGTKFRKLEGDLGKVDKSMSVYDGFVDQLAKKKKKTK